MCYVQYHGGTNFDRTAGGPFIATSYDYDAPIDEYGSSLLRICVRFQLYFQFCLNLWTSEELCVLCFRSASAAQMGSPDEPSQGHQAGRAGARCRRPDRPEHRQLREGPSHHNFFLQNFRLNQHFTVLEKVLRATTFSNINFGNSQVPPIL